MCKATFLQGHTSHRKEMNFYPNSRIRQIAVSAFAAISFAAGHLGAQMPSPQGSTLPATSPTSLPAPIATTPVAVVTPARRATVLYAAGMLNVRADNSSLNQILREISRLTGMKITGGVVDERVFGNYGPAEPSTVLATLLGGTGSNILLRESDTNAPAELILTPRNGGPTPPNPNAPGYDDGEAQDVSTPPQPPTPPQTDAPARFVPLPPQASGPQSIPQPANNVNGSPSNTSPTASTFPVTNSVPTDTVPTPSTTPPTAGIVDAPNPPPPGSTTSTPSTTPKTPEQIYQQLQQLQQQQSKTAPSTPQ